jgi:hypothetical protein
LMRHRVIHAALGHGPFVLSGEDRGEHRGKDMGRGQRGKRGRGQGAWTWDVGRGRGY